MITRLSNEHLNELFASSIPLTIEKVRLIIKSTSWKKEEVDKLLQELNDDYETSPHNDTKMVIEVLKELDF